MEYRCVATSLSGFVQQVATAYVPHGYWFYVQGFVPDGKNPDLIDRKLIETYGIAVSKWQRTRRKQKGLANLQYLRFRRCFVIMATKGKHPFFEFEASSIRDIRKMPIKIAGYSISARNGPDGRLHSHVRVSRHAFNDLLAWFVYRAAFESTGTLIKALYNLPFEPYAPVRRQYLTLLRRTNEVRGRHGRQKLPADVLPLRRRIVRPFDPVGDVLTGKPGALG